MPSIVRLRLGDILQEKQITRQQLANQAGLRPSTVSDLCNRPVQRIYLSTIATLCETLDVSVSDLFVIEPAD
ncbi:helix-turn-helix transcriptional regulator [Aneurinibacillus thermoaerophilus]|uniref:helix-turn-helix domain-containing protein n=1 Tax=Paenibacillaceae TaxID=186822 RepID=UPI0018CD1CCE|nr:MULTISPECIES: helix-turn-helix transcriptional regulator [Paenibacillaceae]MBG9795715.1 transcriptional regulator [Paenibacillus dendritiformis]MED0759120.1 helix-turn-helix transcriptional regulator [Aneurinibacillus thermoaerophilus]MED0762712.1 helix-turn-helix transcriptional regulator [Aneurinibacillus thermoaerophilus]